MKWWEKPLRIAAVQCNYGEDSLSILKNHVIPGDFNTEQLLHLMAEGHMASYEEDVHGSRLDEYLEKAHKNNIRVIVYWNVHSMQKRYRDSNPEWVQRDKNNDEVTAYETHYLLCINSEWYETYSENLKKLCKHNIDGIFLDGPVVTAGGCFCSACSKKFEEKYNKPIKDASYQEMLNFKVDSVTEFVRKTNAIVKNINPDILLYLNNSALRADVTGSNTRKVEPWVDMIGAEGGFVWVDKNTTLWHASSMAKCIEAQAKGKPTVIFIAGDHKPHSYYMHTAEETKILYAQSVANGANVWYGIHAPTYIMDTPGGRAAKEFNSFLARNEEYYSNTKPVSKVAIMWSMDSANYYSSYIGISDFAEVAKVSGTNRTAGTKGIEKHGNHYKAFMGFYEILTRSHIQFDVVDEYSITDGSLSKYELLILPTCGCMSSETAEGIRKFVANGGKLISTFDTGFFDEKGRFFEKPILADVMGIEKFEALVEYPVSGTDFMRIDRAQWAGEGISADIIPFTNYAIRFIPAKGVVKLAEALEPMKGRYEPLPGLSYPCIVHARYGDGESVYISGTIGEIYNAKTNPDHRKLIENIINKLSVPLIITDAPGSVEMVLRYQEDKDRYILHIINMTGEMVRPIERVIPLNNVEITLNLADIQAVKANLKEVKSLKCITAGKTAIDIPFSRKNGLIKFTVPEIKTYEVLIVE
ncbi:MAG: beta-galactosidase trimerization domain-containing protein [Firmicutes bacterium]|nr:beta-galactosidase trimerization domain-containing protein [Bacillota bacterium]